MSRLTAPLDQLHADCLDARNWVRYEFAQLASEVNAWEPKPCPPLPPREEVAMVVHGWCHKCRKFKRVRVDMPDANGVQIGTCDDCEAKR